MRAIVLAAGYGSRLRGAAPIKPLASIAGRALILHVLDRLAVAGFTHVTAVLGYEAEAVSLSLADAPAGLSVTTRINEEWATAPNGVSLLAAADLVSGGTLLTMADHLVEPELYAQVVRGGDCDLRLGVDRRLGHDWIDENDVTRVQTREDQIMAIGKGIVPYDAYDTGVFMIGTGYIDVLASMSRPSLSDGVAALAAAGRAMIKDVGDCAWIDVDDYRALMIAESQVSRDLSPHLRPSDDYARSFDSVAA